MAENNKLHMEIMKLKEGNNTGGLSQRINELEN